MRAVWSLWSKPFAAATSWGWHRPEHHLLAWGLSLRLARRHYPETTLVTDSAGKALLVDALGLSFASVSTELDRLRDADPNLWALGKLVAYSIQDEPFVHLDTDVFLWRALPTRLTSAPVLAQHRERWFERDPGGGDPQLIEDAFAHAGLKLPVEWEWARSRWGKTVFEANCGIAGGHPPLRPPRSRARHEPPARRRVGEPSRQAAAESHDRAVHALGLLGLPSLPSRLAVQGSPRPISVPLATGRVRPPLCRAARLHPPPRRHQAPCARRAAPGRARADGRRALLRPLHGAGGSGVSNDVDHGPRAPIRAEPQDSAGTPPSGSAWRRRTARATNAPRDGTAAWRKPNQRQDPRRPELWPACRRRRRRSLCARTRHRLRAWAIRPEHTEGSSAARTRAGSRRAADRRLLARELSCELRRTDRGRGRSRRHGC
jgi:hypothetical protein